MVPDLSTSSPERWVAVIAHPRKTDMAALREAALVASEQAGWAPPRFWETTVDDTGRGQAQEAVAAGAHVVAVSGGDGTVRAVAGVLAGTGVRLALFPAGTGNLLARSLDISHTSRSAAIGLLTSGQVRRIDCMDVLITSADGRRWTETSVVGLGVGYNADLMAGVDEEMKRRTGWFAYVVSGARALRTHAVRVRIGSDLADPTAPLVDQGVESRSVRSILVMSCGILVGGLRLVSGSTPDDGVVESVIASPRGPGELLLQLGRVVSHGGAGGPRVQLVRSRRSVTLECPKGTMAQIDGDPVGHVIRLEVTLRAGALHVLAP